MKGNFLILLVTANTTYTAFDLVYTKIMLYTQQFLFSQSDKSWLYKDTNCISTNTDVYVVYPQLHPVYAQIRVVSQHIKLYIHGHMLYIRMNTICIKCLNEDSIAYLTTEIKSKESQIISSFRIYILRIVFLLIMQ